MPLPTLESLAPAIDRLCADVLGDTIEYRAVGSPTYAPTRAFVDYRDGTREYAGAQLVMQSPRVTVLKVDVPAKPNRDVRVKLARRAGKMFRPTNVTTDSSGTHWEFDCEETADG